MRKFLALLALPAVLLMTSCKDKEVTVNGEKVVLEEGLYGFFKTTQGDIVVKFEDKKAPMTTANFIALAEGRHEDVSEEYKGKINIYKIDTEAEQELSAAFGIKSIPSMLFCPAEGQPQMAQGALPKQELQKLIREVLKAEVLFCL